MFAKKETKSHFLWIKVAVMILALIGIFWARSGLEKAAQPNNVEDLAPIPAKVETGK